MPDSKGDRGRKGLRDGGASPNHDLAAGARSSERPAAFDYAGSLARMGGNEALFSELVGFLWEDGPRCIERIRSAIEDRESGRAAHAARIFGGLVSNFGANRAVSAAAEAEHKAREGRFAEIPAAVREMEDALEELLQALSPFKPAEHESATAH